MPNAHYISRAHGGLGIEKNVVTLCFKCHHNYDNGKDKDLSERIKKKIEYHLNYHYPNWKMYTIKY